MAKPSLIGGYLSELSAELSAPIVAELVEPVGQTHQHYLGQGLDPDAAARAALAEFGEPRVIVAAFTRASPARRAARRLLVTGPLVGACWAAALTVNRAWDWPVPGAARILLGTALITAIGLLAAAAFGKHYRPARRAAAAGCVGMAALDATMLIAATLAAPAVIWPVMVAATASLARITFTTRTLHSVLTG
jgi:hypothetical protein